MVAESAVRTGGVNPLGNGGCGGVLPERERRTHRLGVQLQQTGRLQSFTGPGSVVVFVGRECARDKITKYLVFIYPSI